MNLKLHLQHGITELSYQVDYILYQIFKINFSILLET